jgi:hypothetical protein
MGLHDPFADFKHKLWPKEGSRVKLVVWLPTTKSRKSPRSLCVQVACNILLKNSWQGYKKNLDLISIEGLHTKLCAPIVVGVLTLGILGLSGLPLGNPKTKWHLGASLVSMHNAYYKKEGGGFPQVWAVVSLVNPCLPVVFPSIKSTEITH